MGDKHTHAPLQEHSEPDAATAEKAAPRAKTPASAYYPPHLSITGIGAPDGPPLTRNDLLFLQRTVGNRALSRFLQMKMMASAAGEGARGAAREGKEVPVQAERAEGEIPSVGPDLQAQLRSSRGNGQPLQDSERGLFESTLGHDFGRVSLHTDAAADTLNRSLNARAFTTGQDIYFRQGEYRPGTSGGRELLSHELTHVVQQASGPVSGTPVGGGVSLSDPSDAHEQAASRTAETVMRKLHDAPDAGAASVQRRPSSPTQDGAFVQRQQAESADASTAKSLIGKYMGMLGGLDEEGLGAELASVLPAQTGLVFEVLQRLPDDDTDDVAQEIVIGLGARLGSVDEALRMRFVWDMVYGTVTDSEEGVIAQIWESYGPRMQDMAAAYPKLWADSIDESDQLNELPLIVSIREGFENDVINLAKNYLWENKLEVLREQERLGISPLYAGKEMATEPGYLEGLKNIAGKVASLQNFLKELKSIQVGYSQFRDPELRRTYKVPSYFSPEGPPELSPTGGESPPLPAWSLVKEQHERASAVISGFANTYPAIYALVRDDKLEEVAEAGDMTKALAVVSESLSKVIEKIDESREKLSTDDIEFSDLVPIYTQLFQNSVQTNFQPRFAWEHPFYQLVAKDVLSDKEAHDFWTSLGLSLVAAAALIAAPFTGGATLVLLLGTGLGIGAYQAAAAWEKYDDLKTMSGAHVKDSLALITEGQVTAALIDAVISTASLFLDAFGARAATSGARAAGKLAAADAIKAFEAEEQALKQQMAREVRERAAREAMVDAGMELAGAGISIAQHELFGEEELEFEAAAQVAEVDLPQDTSEEASDEASPATVSRMVIQRQPTGGGGIPTMPGIGVAPPPQLTWFEFEEYVGRAFKRGEFGGALRMDYMIPGQHSGSGHGIDLIGIRVDDAGRISVIQVEVKYVRPGSTHVPKLGPTKAGVQAGENWTEKAVEAFLSKDNKVAERNRKRMRRALQKIYNKSYVTDAEMAEFLRKRLLGARVFAVTPDYAVLKKLRKQLAGMALHGRRAALKTIRIHK